MIPIEGSPATKIEALYMRIVADQAGSAAGGMRGSRLSLTRKSAATLARNQRGSRWRRMSMPTTRRSFATGDGAGDVLPISTLERASAAARVEHLQSLASAVGMSLQVVEPLEAHLAWLGGSAQALMGWLGLAPKEEAAPAASIPPATAEVPAATATPPPQAAQEETNLLVQLSHRMFGGAAQPVKEATFTPSVGSLTEEAPVAEATAGEATASSSAPPPTAPSTAPAIGASSVSCATAAVAVAATVAPPSAAAPKQEAGAVAGGTDVTA